MAVKGLNRNPRAKANPNATHALQQKLSRHNANYKRHWQAGDYAAALTEARQARLITRSAEVVVSEALCLIRLDRAQEAFDLASHVPAAQRDVNFIDLMADLCGRLDKQEEGRAYGNLALRLKDEQSAAGHAWPIPAATPPAFTPDPSANIVAYSLFGNSPRYCESAILNCHAVAKLLPGWSARFYHDQSVPGAVLRRLREAGAQLLEVDAATQAQVPPLMWRFLVADAPEARRFLLRDADSVVGEREKACVDAWLASPFWFHLIRDWYTHSELLLAGLWGGCAGVFPAMRDEIAAFMAQGERSPTHYDQHFLRQRIWPTVRQSVLSHDSQFDFYNNTPIPFVEGARCDNAHHIGANLGFTLFEGNAPYPDGTLIRWTLHDQDGEAVCAYETAARRQVWRAHVPFSYAEKVQSGQWTVRTVKISPDASGADTR